MSRVQQLLRRNGVPGLAHDPDATPAVPLPADPTAEDLIGRHLPLAYRLARWAFRGRRWREWLPRAEDAAVDGLARAVRQYVPGRGGFRSFVVRVILDKLRKLRRRLAGRVAARPEVQSLDRLLEHGEDFDSTLFAARPDAPADLPPELLARLTPGQRDVLHRRYVLGQSFREIANDRAGRPRRPTGKDKCASVKRQHDRALNALRVTLGVRS